MALKKLIVVSTGGKRAYKWSKVLWFRPQINGDGVVVLAEWEAAKGLGESQTHVAIHPDNIDALITILQRAKVQAAKYQAQVKIKEKASR